MANRIRASVVQASTAAYDLAATLEKLESYARLAKQRDDAQLVVFPEALYSSFIATAAKLANAPRHSIGGYPKMSSFGLKVGDRRPEGRNEFLRYANAAIEIPSPTITRLEQLSADLSVFMVVGIVERDRGTLYCTVVFIDPSQGYLAKHRKILPTGMERTIWGRGYASTLPVPEVSFESVNGPALKARVSATICWENYMPLLRTFYYSKGTQIYCAPTVDAGSEWQITIKHIAREGRCFVLSACQYAEEKDFPEGHAVVDEAKRNPSNVMIGGGSAIVSPFGEVLAGPLLGEEGVLSADLDLDEIVKGKFDFDVVGHYSRPDIFKLTVSGL
ncbi:Nitrilase [Steccherinum ochraceum]|uniref:Nitrilase n=1 Tax=Steccherinum ochraceum TaxID=92696 RepID=A0A4R0R6X3_9APHY|nr:Nitrilase [Steccherinum ochraceum]